MRNGSLYCLSSGCPQSHTICSLPDQLDVNTALFPSLQGLDKSFDYKKILKAFKKGQCMA